jgi:predicted GIY-YIG superfamily endonuclease
LSNQKLYIGCTSNLKQRTSIHLHYLRNKKHANKLLQEDFNRFGEESFQFRVLEEGFGKEELLSKETQYIKQFDSNKLYNIMKSDPEHRSKKEILFFKKRKPVFRIELDSETQTYYKSIISASKQTGIPQSNIVACLKGRLKTAGGYRWQYVW